MFRYTTRPKQGLIIDRWAEEFCLPFDLSVYLGGTSVVEKALRFQPHSSQYVATKEFGLCRRLNNLYETNCESRGTSNRTSAARSETTEERISTILRNR